MSTEFKVITKQRSVNLNAVVDQLSASGYACELKQALDTQDDIPQILYIKVVRYPTVKPRVRPERNILVSIEIDVLQPEANDESFCLTVRSSAGRSRLTFSIQIMIAAIIAQINCGTFID